MLPSGTSEGPDRVRQFLWRELVNSPESFHSDRVEQRLSRDARRRERPDRVRQFLRIELPDPPPSFDRDRPEECVSREPSRSEGPDRVQLGRGA